MSDKPPRQRTPNAQRSANTRAKIINAAIACLHEVGYHQTSTVLVTERAGVSRGAMLHHFRSKADLVNAVAEELQSMRAMHHQSRLSETASKRERFFLLIDVLWEAMLTPSGIARIELMLSTRGDPDMADTFNALNDKLDKAHKDAVWRLASELGLSGEKDRERIDAFVQLYAAACRGLAIDALRAESRQGADAAIALLKDLQKRMLDDMLQDHA